MRSPSPPGARRAPAAGRGARATLRRAHPLLVLVLPLAASSAAAPPSTAPPASAYEAVAGDDWTRYRTRDDLRAADRFWWFRGEDVYEHVDLVDDPLFGRVARIRFAQSPETGFAPKIRARFAPLDRAWFRWRMRFSPGWTTVGPSPPGYANSYKIAFWLWDGYEGRGELQFSNTDEYVTLWTVRDRAGWVRYDLRHLSPARGFGRVSGEWRDGEWYEFVILYEKTAADRARQHWWRRRLTTRGARAPGPWTYVGVEASGAPTPRMSGIILGGNKNRNNPSTMYLSWGPWEVVDGTRWPDPWGIPVPR